jgi:uncharacterized membrane protein
MKKLLLFGFFALFFLAPNLVLAQEQAPISLENVAISEIPKNEYFRAKVLEVTEKGDRMIGGIAQPYQKLLIRIESGSEKGKTMRIDQGLLFTVRDSQLVNSGDDVILTKTITPDNSSIYVITDKYRIPPVIIIAIIFVLLVVSFAGLKGITSLLGMILSVIILLQYIVPEILAGKDPITVTLIGSFGIALVSLYLAHGFNKRISIAVVSTLISLSISVLLAQLFVFFAHLTGSANEEAYMLQTGVAMINLRGLLLGGIIIGALGVLDDITTGQAAAIDEIHKTNPNLTFKELYTKGISIGKEHIASLVNTLVLAYAGASLPIFLLFVLLKEQQPLWVTLNSEFVIEEFTRTLVGSTTLIIAVPLTTCIAAYVYGNKTKTQKSKGKS